MYIYIYVIWMADATWGLAIYIYRFKEGSENFGFICLDTVRLRMSLVCDIKTSQQ